MKSNVTSLVKVTGSASNLPLSLLLEKCWEQGCCHTILESQQVQVKAVSFEFILNIKVFSLLVGSLVCVLYRSALC